MATPSKAKINAIKRYLFNQIDDVFKAETKIVNGRLTTKYQTQLTSLQRKAAKAKEAIAAYNNELREVNEAARKDEATIKTPTFSTHSYNNEDSIVSVVSNKPTRSWGHVDGYYSNYNCTVEQFPRATKAVKEIETYCLELLISPDMTDVETFARNLIKGIK